MVENTVGRIYLDYDKTSDLKSEMKYLVESQEQDTVIARNEANSSLIHNLEELTLIDPASGSGHILVTGFELLFKMYREQGYTAKNAVISILQNNIYGLDIDDRAMQLARFAVLLKAAEYYPEILQTPPSGVGGPHIYSFPDKYHFHLEDLQNFLSSKGGNFVAELKEALVVLNEGKNIGAALKLEMSAEAHNYISNQYQNWNSQYQAGTLDILQQDLWNNLKPFLEVLLIMTKKYTSVVANPPYMGQKSMNAELKNYVNGNYPISKSDLFAVFMEVCLSLNVPKGLMGMINQHSWMFLSSYEKLREHIIGNYGIINMLHLGPRTFEELSGEVVQSTAFVLENAKGIKDSTYFRLVDYKNNNDKETNFLNRNNQFENISQENFEKIPGSPIAYWVSENIISLFENDNIGDNSFSSPGVRTGKDNIFIKFWFEINYNLFSSQSTSYDDIKSSNKKWYPLTRGGGFRKWYGNYENVINLMNEAKEIKEQCHDHRLRDSEFYFKNGVTWTMISSYKSSFRIVPEGVLYGNGGPVVFSEINNILLAFLNSKLSDNLINLINPTLNITKSDIEKLPNSIYDNKVQDLSLENIKLSQRDYSKYEYTWDFEQSPLFNESTSLKEAYQEWQNNATQDFFQLHENEEELNRIFIEIYGLQEELTPEVALKDITILQEELNRSSLEQLEPVFRAKGANEVQLPIKKDEVMSQFLSYSIGVFMGRYRLDKPGLHIAHPNPSEDELTSYEVSLQEKKQTIEIDDDAIIPLMGSECTFPDDALVRIKNLIHTVWSENSQIENSNFINECLGMDLDKWLTEKFWGFHTSMYKKKPIYWLFSSNPKKPQAAAFKVLVYMHRMDKYTVSKIQRNYLHPHQEWIKQEREKLLKDEANLSKIELKRLEKLRNWEIECRDYNEVLKTLALNEVVFDLDDGVTVNYEKFEGAVAKI